MDINFNHSLPWSFLSLSCSMCMKHFQNGSSNLWSTWCTVLSLKLWMVSVDVNSIIKGEHFPGFLLKKKRFYIFERQSYGEWKRWRAFICWLSHQMSSMARSGPNPRQISHMGERSKHLNHLLLFQALDWKWSSSAQTGVHIGCWWCRRQLNITVLPPFSAF